MMGLSAVHTTGTGYNHSLEIQIMTTKHIEFKNASGLHIAEVLANRGIYFQVRDDEGEEYAVPKKQVTRGPWEEPTDEEEADADNLIADAAAHPILGAMLSQMQKDPVPTPKAKKEKAAPAERDPNLVSLKQLCFELDLEPRIVRRRLRKAVGHVGTGGRWEWMKGSQELLNAMLALAAPAADAGPVADADDEQDPRDLQAEADAEEDMGDAAP